MALDPYSLSYGRQEGSGEAQILGQSSFDPVKFTERTTQMTLALAQQRKKRLSDSLAAMKKEMDFTEMSEWDDQQTSGDLLERQQSLENEYTQAHMHGMNLSTPSSRTEYEMLSGIKSEQKNINRDIALHNETKDIHDAIQKEIAKQILLSPDERTMNIGDTRQAVQHAIEQSDPLEKIGIMRRAIVYKAPALDTLKYINTNLPDWLKEKEDFRGLRRDPTGKILADIDVGYDVKDVRKAFGDMYENMPQEYRDQEKKKHNQARNIYGKDIPETTKEWFIQKYGYPTRKHRETQVKGGREQEGVTAPGPPRDPSTNEFVHTNNSGHIYTQSTGEVMEYKSPITWYLGDKFAGTSDAIPLNVSEDTYHKTEARTLNAGLKYLSLGTNISMYPVADADMAFPELTGQSAVRKGERIPDIMMQMMVAAQQRSGGVLTRELKFHYEPFYEDLSNISGQIVDTDDLTVKSWKDPTIRPYFEVADQLKMFKDDKGNFPFIEIDKQIREGYNQLNRDLLKGIWASPGQSQGPNL